MSVTVIASFELADGRRNEFLVELARIVPAVLAEPGCLSYVPHIVGRDRVVVVESWESGDALSVHAVAEPLTSFTKTVADLLASDMDVVVARPIELSTLEVTR